MPGKFRPAIAKTPGALSLDRTRGGGAIVKNAVNQTRSGNRGETGAKVDNAISSGAVAQFLRGHQMP